MQGWVEYTLDTQNYKESLRNSQSAFYVHGSTKLNIKILIVSCATKWLIFQNSVTYITYWPSHLLISQCLLHYFQQDLANHYQKNYISRLFLNSFFPNNSREWKNLSATILAGNCTVQTTYNTLISTCINILYYTIVCSTSHSAIMSLEDFADQNYNNNSH